MTEATIAERLRAACRCHPAAQIQWPHQLLHEAADRIEELEEALEWVALSKTVSVTRGDVTYSIRSEVNRLETETAA